MSRQFRPLLALFVKNERLGCEVSIPQIDRSQFSDIFSIDAGSTDGSAEYLESQGIRVYRQVSPGYSGAYNDAADLANGRPFIVFHPKGTVSPEVLMRMVAELDSGADLVIASRMLAGGRNADDISLFRHRKWFGGLAGFVLHLRFGRKLGMPCVTDPLHGVRGFSSHFLKVFNLTPNSVAADLEIVRLAYASKLRIVEIPVSEAQRISGNTNFPTFRTGRALFKYLLS
jgi:glycosyltransferase involved in cell wall biosynthesis